MNKRASNTPLVLRYVFAILAVVVAAVSIVIVSLYAAQQRELEARDRIQFVHLDAVAESTELARELRALRARVIDNMDSGAPARSGAAGIQSVQIGFSGILQSMRSRLNHLSVLEEGHDEQIFALTLTRLGDRFYRLDRDLRFAEPSPESITYIDVMSYTVEQYQRLHKIAADRALLELSERQRQRPRFLAVLLLCLAFGAIAAWYLVRSLRASLQQQETAEHALLESQERMHHLQKIDALGGLVGGIAHDFNNWLTVILGHAGLLHDKAGEDENLKSGLEEIRQAGLQAASLTKQLLAFSRKERLQPQVLDLNPLIQSMEDMLHSAIGADIGLTLSYADDLCEVEVDPDQMQQVILNLINNARDAMPDGGLLSITTERAVIGASDVEVEGVPAGEWARLCVSDTGTGMDPATRQRIFEPFFSTKDRGHGTGLGLSTVHGIVTSFDGHILVESEEGAGSKLVIFLPCAKRVETKADKVTGASAAPGGTETVLIVEDNKQVRLFVEAGLTSLGYRVLSATGGAAGLEVCSRHQDEINVILSDVVMPGTSGPKFMAAALKRRPDAVAIYMSAYTRDEVLGFRRNNDAADIPLISKPFEIETLSRMIRKQLDRKQNP